MRDAWRLAAGTFLAIPVTPPSRVDASVGGRAMALAPATALLGSGAWVVLGICATNGWLPAPVAAVLALAVTALASRAMHLDGLADTADGLTSGAEPERCLSIMRRGDTGPAGAAALVLTLLLQAAAVASLLPSVRGLVLAAVALVASRLAPAIACRRGVPPARSDGLGAAVAGSVGPLALTVSGLAVGLAGSVALQLAGARWYAADLVLVAAGLCAWLVVRHAVRRLGGITGDVIGAAIELSLAVGLVTASVCAAVV